MDYRIEWKSTEINDGHAAFIALDIIPNYYVAYIYKDMKMKNNNDAIFFKTFETAYAWCCGQLLEYQEAEAKYKEKIVYINQKVEKINTFLGIKPL